MEKNVYIFHEIMNSFAYLFFGGSLGENGIQYSANIILFLMILYIKFILVPPVM